LTGGFQHQNDLICVANCVLNRNANSGQIGGSARGYQEFVIPLAARVADEQAGRQAGPDIYA